jgi:hypothetical protein
LRMKDLGMGPALTARQRPRRGCLGCLTSIIGTLLIIGVVGSVLYVASERVFHPWAFYLGGHSHLLPAWQGVGRAHTPAGDYTLTVFLQPTRGGRTFNLPSVKGTGYLCTPRGERFRLFITGGLTEKTGTDTNGKTMSLRYYRHPVFGGISGDYEQPPRLELRGTWQNPDLVMDDGGSLAAAFLSDGSVSPKPNRWYHADAKNKVPIVFHETSVWQRWDERCQAK